MGAGSPYNSNMGFKGENRHIRSKQVRGMAVGTGLLLAAALLFILFSGGEGAGGLPGHALGQESGQLLLFAEGEMGPFLVYSQDTSGFFCAVDPSTGDMARAGTSYPLLKAASRDGRLFIFREDGPFLCAAEFDHTLEEQASCTPPLFLDDLFLFDCTSQGGIYGVAQSDKRTLQYHQRDGSMLEKAFPGDIAWLQVTGDGKLWVYAGGALYLGDSLDPGSLQPLGGGEPQHAISGEAYIGTDGRLWRVAGAEALPVLEGPFAPSLCCAYSGGILYGTGSGQVSRLLWDGTPGGSCRVEGELVALTEKSILYRSGGQLFYAAVSLGTATPVPSLPPALTPLPSSTPSLSPAPSFTPLPSPTLSVSPSPTPVGTDELKLQGGYMFVAETLTLSRLREIFHPQEVLVRTAEGEPLAQGRLATGMTAALDREYCLVVRGDCDGSGKVDGQDVRRGQEILLLGKGSVAEAFFLAADVDEDGAVTTKDLLWIAGHFT